MRYLLGLILLISVSASAQYSPTAAKTRFVNGIGLGTKDTSTMNAADTVAMIVGRDSLVYFRYRGYWKPLAYNSSLTGYVPYTGATSSVNLGSYNLTANKIAIGGSISAVALDVHRAGSIVARIENTNASQDALFAYAQSAQNVWFTGIDYSSGANNFGFYYTPDGTTVLRKAYFSNAGDLTANSFIKSGGTSSQFLKADGSVTTTIPSGSIDTGRAVTAITTGGSLNKVRDSLQANIGLKLNISDTATMLSPYARLYSVVKYTDTASMLSGYKTYYPRAALSAGTGITYNASTGVITNSSPSTGGTVTSVATNTGSGITGGTITTSGTIAADTSVLSTKANVTASLLSKVSSVSGTSPIASSGGLTPTISISQSSGSTNGYLSSTDWTTFNNKGSGSVTSIATDATMTGGTITTSGTLKVDTSVMATRLRVQKGIDSLGAAKQSNITLTTTGTSGAATFTSNTLNIPQYQTAGTYITSVTGTSPIVSSGGTTPAISIPVATTSVNGYLSSTDWTTFNNKQSALTNPVTGSGTTNYLPKFTGSSTIGNSLVYDNGSGVGINTTSISAVLDVNTAGSSIRFGDKVTVSNDINVYYRTTGIARNDIGGGGTFTWGISGSSELMRLNASGNVGIGTTSPSYKLQVYNSANGTSAAFGGTTYGIRIDNGGTYSSGRSTIFGVDNSFYGSYQPLSIEASSITLQALSGGNVGIGTTSPNELLSLAGSTSTTFGISLTPSGWNGAKFRFVVPTSGDASILSYNYNGSAVDYASYSSSAITLTQGLLTFGTGGVGAVPTERMRITSAGNVGIGTTTPSDNNSFGKIVDLNGTSGSAYYTRYNGSSTIYSLFGQDVATTYLATATTPLSFYINSAERARIFSDGNLGLGTSTNAGYKLDVNGTGRFSDAATTILTLNSSNGSGFTALEIKSGGTSKGLIGYGSYLTTDNGVAIRTAASTPFTIAIGSATPNFTIASTGAATFSSSVTATGFFESSDRRLKNIVSRNNDMVTFKWKQGDTLLHYGYIAQEVEKTMPDQVKTDEKGMKSVNYIEVLVKKINDLENRIKQLEK